MEAKDLVTMASTIIAVFVFGKGVGEYVHANVIRRYEKFHDMSVRFDENKSIQTVCTLLHGANGASAAPTKQEKEVFICFLEEIYFMMKSKIMKQDLALYTYGYYGRMALDSEQFWQGLNKKEPFYTHFLDFCNKAKSYQPAPGAGDLAY